MIEEFAKLIPESIKNLSGAVFYSGRNAFQGKKALYIIGLNPGGSEIKQVNDTIALHTNSIILEKNDNWSEYMDGFWNGPIPGASGLQPRILHLLNKLNLSPHEVPSSNICFVRSSRERIIASKLVNYSELCWPFHEKVIKELKVKVILCFGKTAGRIVKRKLNANEFLEEFIEANNRRWRTQVFQNSTRQVVIVASHPSIADWTNPNTDPSLLVKKFLSKIE